MRSRCCPYQTHLCRISTPMRRWIRTGACWSGAQSSGWTRDNTSIAKSSYCIQDCGRPSWWKRACSTRQALASCVLHPPASASFPPQSTITMIEYVVRRNQKHSTCLLADALTRFSLNLLTDLALNAFLCQSLSYRPSVDTSSMPTFSCCAICWRISASRRCWSSRSRWRRSAASYT